MGQLAAHEFTRPREHADRPLPTFFIGSM